MIFCTSCGKKLNKGAQFCDACGAKTIGDKPTPAETPLAGTPGASGSTKTNVSNPSSDDQFSTIAGEGIEQHVIGAQVGRVLGGRYQLDDCIGSGGMGEIYKARRLHIGDTVAVKVLRPDVVENEKSRQRFYREARAAAMLHHPNAVVIHDFGEDSDGTTYIVMELLVGRSLRQLLVDEGPITPGRAYSIMRQACAAIDAGHRNGIVHRDIKPDNIVLIESHHDDMDLVKILDFGIAKVRDSAIDTHSLEQRLTNFGTIIGTPHYMSPEQCQGEEADARSDIYSIGVVLYELLTGVAPFVAKTPTGIAIKHVTEAPRSLRELNPAITPEVEKVVLHALEKNPNSRPQTALDLAREFESALGGEQETAFSSQETKRVTPLIPEKSDEIEGTAILGSSAGQVSDPTESMETAPAPRSFDTVVGTPESENTAPGPTSQLTPTDTSEHPGSSTDANLKLKSGTDIMRKSEDTSAIASPPELSTGKIDETRTGKIDAGTSLLDESVESQHVPDTNFEPVMESPVEAETESAPATVPAPVPETVAMPVTSQVGASPRAVSAPKPARTAAAKSPVRLYAGIGAAALIIISIGIWWAMSGSSGEEVTNSNAAGVTAASDAGNQPATEPTSAYPEVTAPDGMVYVLGGVLRIGRDEGEPNERPAHVETIKPFFIDRTEVSNEQYRLFIEASGYLPPPSWQNNRYPEGRADYPVTDVTWEDATAYATWSGKRLPTEEEWEFAARGPEGRIYPWGNKFAEETANVSNKQGEKRQIAPVGQFTQGASLFGVVDLVGNVWEWTASDYKAYPGGAIEVPAAGYKNLKVIRGGSYESTPKYATTTIRRGWPASRKDWPDPGRATYSQTGFRCAMDADI